LEIAGAAMTTAAVALFVGCAMAGSVAPPVTATMLRAAGGISAAKLNEGRRIFGGQCTTCHTADPVSRYTVGEWHAIIDDDMGQRAKLDRNQRDALMAYISAAHSAPRAQ
jgi:mono/diheme cytochrome c family protein